MMRYHLQSALFIILALSALSGCEQRDKNKVTISIHLDSAKYTGIDIATFDLVNQDTLLLAKFKLDSNGYGTVAVNIASPVYAIIQTTLGQYIPIYIQPGDELEIFSDSVNTNNNFRFAGDGAPVNRFLRSALDAEQHIEKSNGKNVIDIVDDAEFLERIKTYQKNYDRHFASLQSDRTIDPQTIEICASMKKITEYYFYQKYTQSRYVLEENEGAIPASMLNILDDFPDDSLALATNMFRYGMLLNSHLQSNIFTKVANHTETVDPLLLEDRYASITDSLIQKEPLSKPLRDYLRAANINFWVGMEGLSPELQLLRDTFTNEVAVPKYVSAINKSFNLWENLAPGKPAPDFTGQTADGKDLSLSSLKGKVVYVDVWATWCGPCKDEFSDSQKLIQAFEGNEKVAFLFVSTDENVGAWKKMLSDKNTPKGIHINQPQHEQQDAIWQNYRLWGIPRYILIDANGNILQTHAPRPSSGKMKGLLEKVIQG